MVVVMRSNLKAMGKGILKTAKLDIYKYCGNEIAVGVFVEFDQLLRETAQYTGRTVASWNIAMKGTGSFGGVREPPWAAKIANKELSPLEMGHSASINIALEANKPNFENVDLYKKVLTSGINVWNESEGAESGIPEEGPLRDVNLAAKGAFARFEDRIAKKVFRPLKGKIGQQGLIHEYGKLMDFLSTLND